MLSGWQLKVSKLFIIPQRWIVSMFGFLAIMIAYTIRTALSFAITKMVVKHSGGASELECQLEEDQGPSNKPPSTGDFDWDEELQGFILASFYVGYVITHVPGGVLASRYGGKYTLIVGMCVASFFTLITPVCVAAGGAPALIVLRILIGLGEGVIFPSCAALIASWTPITERGKIGTLTYSGAQIGSIFGSLVSGALLGAYDGWGSVFYFFGCFGIVWSLFFFFMVYNSPDDHPYVSDKEKEYLKKELGSANDRTEEQKAVPWRYLLASPAVLSLIVAQIGHNWGFFIMVTDLPKYMNDVLKFSIKENGVYSSLPYITMFIAAQVTGIVTDWMIKKKYATITNVRKFCTAVAAIGPGAFIVGASYAECDRITVVVLFTVGMGFMGMFYSGIKVNTLDLAPRYAGVIMALANGVGGISGIFSPYIVGVMTPNSLMMEWRLVFWVTFAVFAVTTVVYLIWASGEVQPWNEPENMGLVESGNKSVDDSVGFKTTVLGVAPTNGVISTKEEEANQTVTGIIAPTNAIISTKEEEAYQNDTGVAPTNGLSNKEEEANQTVTPK